MHWSIMTLWLPQTHKYGTLVVIMSLSPQILDLRDQRTEFGESTASPHRLSASVNRALLHGDMANYRTQHPSLEGSPVVTRGSLPGIWRSPDECDAAAENTMRCWTGDGT